MHASEALMDEDRHTHEKAGLRRKEWFVLCSE